MVLKKLTNAPRQGLTLARAVCSVAVVEEDEPGDQVPMVSARISEGNFRCKLDLLATVLTLSVEEDRGCEGLITRENMLRDDVRGERGVVESSEGRPDSSIYISTAELFGENKDLPPILKNDPTRTSWPASRKRTRTPAKGSSAGSWSSKKMKVGYTPSAKLPRTNDDAVVGVSVAEEMIKPAQDSSASPEAYISQYPTAQVIFQRLGDIWGVEGLTPDPAVDEALSKMTYEAVNDGTIQNIMSLSEIMKYVLDENSLLQIERKQYQQNLQATLKQVAKVEEGKKAVEERLVQAEQKCTEAYKKLEEAQRETASAEAERDMIMGSFRDVKAQKIELVRNCVTLKKAVEEVRVAAEKAAAVGRLTSQLYQHTQKLCEISSQYGLEDADQDKATASKVQLDLPVDQQGPP